MRGHKFKRTTNPIMVYRIPPEYVPEGSDGWTIDSEGKAVKVKHLKDKVERPKKQNNTKRR